MQKGVHVLLSSIQKIINHIKKHPSRQNYIFNSLTKEDICEILDNINNQNKELRLGSAKLLCTLLYQNEQIKTKVAKILKVEFCTGRISFNKIPEKILRNHSLLKEVIKLLKDKIQVSKMECWFIKIKHNKPFIQYLNLENLEQLPDPNEAMIGFTFIKNFVTRYKSSIERKQTKSRSINSRSSSIGKKKLLKANLSTNETSITQINYQSKYLKSLHNSYQNKQLKSITYINANHNKQKISEKEFPSQKILKFIKKSYQSTIETERFCTKNYDYHQKNKQQISNCFGKQKSTLQA